jgi:hypothetical protein
VLDKALSRSEAIITAITFLIPIMFKSQHFHNKRIQKHSPGGKINKMKNHEIQNRQMMGKETPDPGLNMC